VGLGGKFDPTTTTTNSRMTCAEEDRLKVEFYPTTTNDGPQVGGTSVKRRETLAFKQRA
jgi:hypothetical protein